MEIDPDDHQQGDPIKNSRSFALIAVKEEEQYSEKKIGEDLRTNVKAGREDRHRPNQSDGTNKNGGDPAPNDPVEHPDNATAKHYLEQDNAGTTEGLIKPIKNDLGQPLVVNPAVIWSRIGIEIVCRELPTLDDLPAEEEMPPEVVIHGWIGEKIEEGGEKKKSKKSRIKILLRRRKTIRVGLQRVFGNWADSSSRWTILPLISYVW